MWTRLLCVLLFLLLSACATSGIPEAIRQAPPGDLSIGEARDNIATHVGQRVRWGGRVVGVENHANETWLDIVARPLNSDGRPRIGDESLGRFIARVNGFLDPAIYTKGREVTVAGTVERTITRSIGDYLYPYVVIKADTTELWEPRVERPIYYDPFYDPFWPTRMYPWYGPYPFYPYWPYW